MEPTDQYLKSRRNLVLFSGLLALSATVGLDFAAKESGSLLPVTLRDANFLDEIFAILVLYFAFQASLFWYAQTSAVQRLPQYKIDFWSSIVLSSCAFGISLSTVPVPDRVCIFIYLLLFGALSCRFYRDSIGGLGPPLFPP
jgi:hypothetical protein